MPQAAHAKFCGSCGKPALTVVTPQPIYLIGELAPHPWHRNFARQIDYFLIALVIAMTMVMFGIDISHWPGIIWSFLAALSAIPIEALLLSGTGTTPGKWLFNIQVTRNDGTRLSFEQALHRELLVWVQGLACGIPLVCLATFESSRRQLWAKGRTAWDHKCELIVRHYRIGAGRIIGIVSTIATILIFSTLAKS